ncbi:MAG TPA: TetR/AcrR family transcriptional regulator [Candidatus Tenderia sp.]|nr:TetR/AcrR family transcriptional regulator [Candidatus Tenderia sp.]
MPAKQKYLSADERRNVTVETVIKLAAEQNPSDITTAAIAKRMEVTQGALFRHFPNKDAIWQAVMAWVAERLLARIDKAAARADTALAALEAVFMTHIEFVCDHPGVPRMLFGELQHAKETAPKRMARALIQKYSERLAVLIEQGKANGEIAPEVDTIAASLLFIGTIQGLVMQSLLAGGNTQGMRDKVPGVFAIYRRGIENK